MTVWIVICGCGGNDPWIDSVWSTELDALIRLQRLAPPNSGLDWAYIDEQTVSTTQPTGEAA